MAAAALLGGAPAAAAGDSDARTPTVFVQVSEGYSTYKSQLVQSNDTATSLAYDLGVWAGPDRVFGIALRRESSKYLFKLNGSTLDVGWQDVLLRYRLGFFYAGIDVASATWVAKAPPLGADGKPDGGQRSVDFINVQGSGYGAQLGLRVPAGKSGSVHAEATSVQAQATTQKALDAAASPGAVAHRSALGARLDLDIGGSLGLTKVVDVICGFRNHALAITVDGKSSSETMSTTYVGLAAGWGF